MGYLTDSSFNEKEVFKVSTKTKVTALPLLKNTYRLFYGKSHRALVDSSVAIFKRMSSIRRKVNSLSQRLITHKA